jgi:hypothetical protein
MTKDQMLQKIVYSESLDAAVAALIQYILGKKAIIDANLATEAGKIATLIGSDTAKSVRTIANEELAAQLIPSTAQESLDTLQEIAAWIQSHPGDASAMNTAITNLQTLVGSLPSGTSATTVVGYITAEISALTTALQNKNVGATGETGDNALISASASNNSVSVESTQKLKDAVALAESALQSHQSIKTINGGDVVGSGDITLPAELVANPESLTSAQCEALRIGDVVIKSDSTGSHAYKVSFKSSTGMCLTYSDAENVETIAYDKENGSWSKTDKTVTGIGAGLDANDFDFLTVAQAQDLVAAAITAAETPASNDQEG